jgi:hypothetical protein
MFSKEIRMTFKSLTGALILAAAPLFASAAVAQPLGVTVNPYSSGRIGVAPDGRPIIPVRRLFGIGPYYANPVGADWSRPIIVRRGSVVPEFVPTSLVENWNVPGLRRWTNYSYFVSQTQRRPRIVILNPTTRVVARIIH